MSMSLSYILTILAVIVAAVYLSFGTSPAVPAEYTFPPSMILGKVYSNTMMANFNHRIQFAGGRNDSNSQVTFVNIGSTTSSDK